MKQRIIDAIRNQEWMKITFQRKKDDSFVSREVAPYDIFPQESGKNKGKDRLIGYTRAHEDYLPGVISLYLEDVTSVIGMGEQFDGDQIRRLINPRGSPFVSRNW